MIDRSIAELVRSRQLTYLSAEKLGSLFDCLEFVRRTRVDGDFVEFGIALGGSSICIASALDGHRHFFGFDVFEQIPPPSERDGPEASARYEQIASGESQGINGNKYYGYLDSIYDQVCSNFRDAGFIIDNNIIRLIRGLFEQTLPDSPLEVVSFVHIDCDW